MVVRFSFFTMWCNVGLWIIPNGTAKVGTAKVGIAKISFTTGVCL